MKERLPIVRMLAEAVLIVASILFAFGIDAWWNERQERIEETEILLGLKQEFALSRATLVRQLAYNSDGLDAMEALLAATDRDSWKSDELTVDEALGLLIGPPTTDLGSGVLDALVSAGRIQVLSNTELRIKLAAWEGVFEEVRDDEIIGRNFVFDRVIPYLIRWGVPLTRAFDYVRIQSRMSIEDDPVALSRLLADPEFQTILDVRYGFKSHTTIEYESALEAVDEILFEIDR